MRQQIIAIVLAAMMPALSVAKAETYPSRPITLICPFPPGGPLDTLGRVIGHSLQQSLGQPVVVENIAGANASIGSGRVARAAPDGYTLGLGFWGSHVANGAIYPLSYDVVKDFEPIALLATAPSMLIAKKAMPAKDLTELIAWLRAHPQSASAATVGVASPPHLLGLLFQKETGTGFPFVAYRGAAPAVQDIVGGHVDMMFVSPDVALPQVRAGTIKAYAVTAKSRLASAPDIPTADEAGLPKFYFSLWFALWAPNGTARPIIEQVNAGTIKALAEPATQQKLAGLGLDVPPRAEQSPEALRALQETEIKKWWPVLKAANIKVE